MNDAIELIDDTWKIRVVDLKQYEYCPRVVYYQYCLPGVRPTTYKMAAGIVAQDRVNQLEERRGLAAYGLKTGQRHYHVSVRSEKLGCTGQVDMVIETQDNGLHRLLPVDFKLSRRQPGRHFQLQLACYAMMLEDDWGLPVAEGAIYLIPSKRVIKIPITNRLRNRAIRHLLEIHQMVHTQRVPNATRQRSKCVNCEFRRFCNDVI
ncbi:MAG: CRISPR-associated protein Cas4 [Caldilineaceae bacterium]|nr:CRISPR-associated protein Cas4 [Caldilineaceae bacterium]